MFVLSHYLLDDVKIGESADKSQVLSLPLLQSHESAFSQTHGELRANIERWTVH